MRKNNVLRDLIKAGKPTIGTHVFTAWPGMIEVIGHSGAMDYIEFSGQYAPYDLFALENIGRAVDLFDHMSAMMKLDQQPRTYLCERAVGSGFQNILFADLRSVDDARECIKAMRPETPQSKGFSGAKSTRDAGYVYPNFTLQEYVKKLDEGVLAIMVEKKGCVDNLDEILKLGTIDMVQFGPADYSMSIGLAGQYDHPEVKKAEKYTIETALKHGVRPRVEIRDWKQAEPYMKMGVKDFCIGTDVQIVYRYCKEQGGAMAKALGR